MNSLSDPGCNESSCLQTAVNSKVIGLKINGVDTDIVINNYRDRLFIVLTQYKKLGSLIAVNREAAQSNNGSTSEVFQVRTILGQEETAFHLAARYLTEQAAITKPVLYSICMKDCSLPALKAIKDIIVNSNIC